MPEKSPNPIERAFEWLIKLLHLQSLFNKSGQIGSINYLSTSPSIPMTVYTSVPPDPTAIATNYAALMSKDVNRCENFYDFVCGKFPGANSIPPWYNAIAATDFRVNEINEKILAHLETEKMQGPPIFKKIQAFYFSCTNEVAIREIGMQAIYAELEMIGFPPDPLFVYKINWRYDYIEKLAKIHRLTPLVDFLFDVSVQVDPKSMQINKIFFGNTPATTHASANVETEGLYSFAKFSNVFNAQTPTEPDGQRYEAVRMALKAYIKKVIDFMDRATETMPGEDKFSRQFLPDSIDQVTNFFLTLEKTRREGKYNRVENILRTRVSGMQKEVNFMDRSGHVHITWTNYFETLFAGLYTSTSKSGYFTKEDPVVLVQNVKQLRETFRILHNIKKEDFVLAMWFVVIHSVASMGPKPLQDYRNEYLTAVYTGVDPVPRKLTCLNLVRTHFGYFVGHILSRDKRSGEEQTKVTEMVNNIKHSLLEAVQQAPWIDPTTKAGAKTKLNSVTAWISVWETLKDPDKLQKFYGNSFENGPSFHFTYTTMLRKRRSDMLQTLFTRNDLERKLYPNSASIFPRYYPSFVHLTVPIGAIGPPFYDLGLEAFNYGALGVLITRELWHALDASGRNFDQHGNNNVWWMSPTYQEYGKREEAMVQFFGAIKLEQLKINVDGKHTAIENIADLVGFEVGLRAYHKYKQQHGSEKELDEFRDFTDEKWFTIAFASMHCIHATIEYTYGQMTEDENPPQSIRVNKVMTNSKEFARIWGCPPKTTINFL